MKFHYPFSLTLEGTLLLAHPELTDPRFQNAVILVFNHSSQAGAMGIVVNEPLSELLGEYDSRLAHSPIGQAPVYVGGPVHPHAQFLTAWEWEPENKQFKMHFGLSEEIATQIALAGPKAQLRAYLGYAGWDSGQLEREVQNKNWFVTSLRNLSDLEKTGYELWRTLMAPVRPDLVFTQDIPPEPSLN